MHTLTLSVALDSTVQAARPFRPIGADPKCISSVYIMRESLLFRLAVYPSLGVKPLRIVDVTS